MVDISKIDMDRIEGLLSKFEEISNKLNSMKYVVETGQSEDGNQWYRIWSDGWIEQGGNFGGQVGGWTNTSITYLKSFKDLNYSLFLQGNWSDANASSCKINSRTTSTANVTYANNLTSAQYSKWYACGY